MHVRDGNITGNSLLQTELIDIAPEMHRPLIARWLQLSHVARWWGDPADQLTLIDTTPPDRHALIVEDGHPVGYIRWQAVDRQTLDEAGLGSIPAGAIDIDIFIGETDRIGRGVGPRALALLVDRLVATTDAPLAGLCTSIDNTAAHTAFEKAGFARRERFDDPVYGPCWVYARDLR